MFFTLTIVEGLYPDMVNSILSATGGDRLAMSEFRRCGIPHVLEARR